MRIPSLASFKALDMEFSPAELAALDGEYSEDFHLEHAAHLIVTALRNGSTIEQVKSVPDFGLNDPDKMKAILSVVSPELTEDQKNSFIWSIPAAFTNEDRIYLTSAFLSYGESFSSLLSSFRQSSIDGMPDFVPVTWFKRFFDGEVSLREEGVVLQADVSMVLFGYWSTAEVIDFLVRNVDLHEVTKIRAAGVEDANEIAEMTELLPKEWMEDFFN